MSCHEAPASTIGQGGEAQVEHQFQLSGCSVSLTSQSSSCVTQSISSVPTRTVTKPTLSPLKINCIPESELDQQVSPDPRSVSIVHIVKSPVSDGYNWRKYGQKQVKSPQGSRSYYRCTHSDCCAKKIECSNNSGHVIEIVNKGTHNHDPPRKSNFTKESKHASAAGIVLRNDVTEQFIRMPSDLDPSTSAKDSMEETTTVAERKRPHSSGCEGDGDIIVKEEHTHEPEAKRRQV